MVLVTETSAAQDDSPSLVRPSKSSYVFDAQTLYPDQVRGRWHGLYLSPDGHPCVLCGRQGHQKLSGVLI